MDGCRWSGWPRRPSFTVFTPLNPTCECPGITLPFSNGEFHLPSCLPLPLNIFLLRFLADGRTGSCCGRSWRWAARLTRPCRRSRNYSNYSERAIEWRSRPAAPSKCKTCLHNALDIRFVFRENVFLDSLLVDICSWETAGVISRTNDRRLSN